MGFSMCSDFRPTWHMCVCCVSNAGEGMPDCCCCCRRYAVTGIEKCNQTKMKNRIKHEYTNSSQIVVFIKVSGSGGGVVVGFFFAAVVDAQRSKIFALTGAEHNEMYAQKWKMKKIISRFDGFLLASWSKLNWIHSHSRYRPGIPKAASSYSMLKCKQRKWIRNLEGSYAGSNFRQRFDSIRVKYFRIHHFMGSMLQSYYTSEAEY